jgi:hypothetical protein
MAGSQDEQIQRLRKACGCTSALVTMLVCLVAFLAYELSGTSSPSLERLALTGLGIALAGGIVGKVAGLLWAHARLARLLRLQARGDERGHPLS